MMIFWSYLSNMLGFLRGMQIRLEPQNCGQKLMKMTIKHENDEFLVIYLKHVTGLTGLANPTTTQKLWAITHKNGHKHENDEFSDITHKHVTGLQVVVNRPVTPKLWAITHE